jgi:hypothetical protein
MSEDEHMAELPMLGALPGMAKLGAMTVEDALSPALNWLTNDRCAVGDAMQIGTSLP